MTELLIGDAVDMYVEASRDQLTPASHRGYAAVTRGLATAFEGTPLSSFSPPAGSDLVAQFAEERWGQLAPATYNKSLSVLRAFFAWQVNAGNLPASPTDSLEKKLVDRAPRSYFKDNERDAILTANPDPRDRVPLLLLLDYGVAKQSLRHLRFSDFHRSSSRVTLARGDGTHAVTLDAGFWSEFERLIAVVHPEPSDHVVPKQSVRRYRPSANEAATRIPKDGPPSYLLQGDDGSWVKVSVDLAEPRGEHGTHLWWYACLGRAGVVKPGATRGRRMQTARQTVGRNVLRSTGRVVDVARQLGIKRGGRTGDTYSNRDGDELETTIRRLRSTLRRAYRDSPEHDWWLDPISRFLEYIVEERDLVELSRLSIEMLRSHNEDSPQLHDAADALDRVVRSSQLLARAERESARDHSLLHGHSLVAAWGAMETMTLDLVSAWLLHRPEARSATAVGDIKLAYSMFEALEPHERAEVVARELDAQRGPRSGITRFERLFRAVDLPAIDTPHGSVLASNIYEMQQVRHVFAHKRGIADRDFVRACPHLGYPQGSHIVIDQAAWARVIVTALAYAGSVLTRVASCTGVSLPPLQLELRQIGWRQRGTTRTRTALASTADGGA